MLSLIGIFATIIYIAAKPLSYWMCKRYSLGFYNVQFVHDCIQVAYISILAILGLCYVS